MNTTSKENFSADGYTWKLDKHIQSSDYINATEVIQAAVSKVILITKINRDVPWRVYFQKCQEDVDYFKAEVAVKVECSSYTKIIVIDTMLQYMFVRAYPLSEFLAEFNDLSVNDVFIPMTELHTVALSIAKNALNIVGPIKFAGQRPLGQSFQFGYTGEQVGNYYGLHAIENAKGMLVTSPLLCGHLRFSWSAYDTSTSDILSQSAPVATKPGPKPVIMTSVNFSVINGFPIETTSQERQLITDGIKDLIKRHPLEKKSDMHPPIIEDIINKGYSSGFLPISILDDDRIYLNEFKANWHPEMTKLYSNGFDVVITQNRPQAAPLIFQAVKFLDQFKVQELLSSHDIPLVVGIQGSDAHQVLSVLFGFRSVVVSSKDVCKDLDAIIYETKFGTCYLSVRMHDCEMTIMIGHERRAFPLTYRVDYLDSGHVVFYEDAALIFNKTNTAQIYPSTSQPINGIDVVKYKDIHPDLANRSYNSMAEVSSVFSYVEAEWLFRTYGFTTSHIWSKFIEVITLIVQKEQVLGIKVTTSIDNSVSIRTEAAKKRPVDTNPMLQRITLSKKLERAGILYSSSAANFFVENSNGITYNPESYAWMHRSTGTTLEIPAYEMRTRITGKNPYWRAAIKNIHRKYFC